jgi:DUF2934 family protein
MARRMKIFRSMMPCKQKASESVRKKSVTATKPDSTTPTSQAKPVVASEAAYQIHSGQPISETAIRLCAYRMWETAGKPEGDGVPFWLEAERALGNGR